MTTKELEWLRASHDVLTSYNHNSSIRELIDSTYYYQNRSVFFYINNLIRFSPKYYSYYRKVFQYETSYFANKKTRLLWKNELPDKFADFFYYCEGDRAESTRLVSTLTSFESAPSYYTPEQIRYLSQIDQLPAAQKQGAFEKFIKDLTKEKKQTPAKINQAKKLAPASISKAQTINLGQTQTTTSNPQSTKFKTVTLPKSPTIQTTISTTTPATSISSSGIITSTSQFRPAQTGGFNVTQFNPPSIVEMSVPEDNEPQQINQSGASLAATSPQPSIPNYGGRFPGIPRASGAATKKAGGVVIKAASRFALTNPLAIAAIFIGIIFIFLFFGLLKSSALLPPYEFGATSTQAGELVEITKIGTPEVGNPGDPDEANIVYLITVTYKGPGTADIEVTDQIDAQTEFISSNHPSTSQSGNTIKWTLSGLSPNKPEAINLIVKPTGRDFYAVNQASANVTKTYGGGGTGGTGGSCPTQAEIDTNKGKQPTTRRDTEACHYFGLGVDIFDTNFTPEQTQQYISTYQSLSRRTPADFAAKTKDIVDAAKSVGLNPIIPLAYWRTESAFGEGFGCPGRPNQFQIQLDCILGGPAGSVWTANPVVLYVDGSRCARDKDPNSPACKFLAGRRASHPQVYAANPIQVPPTTFDDLAEAIGGRAPNLEEYNCKNGTGTHQNVCSDLINRNCTHTYNLLAQVVTSTNSCKVSAPATSGGNLAQCTFTKGDQTPPSVPYQSSKLLGYFQEASSKTTVPAAVLAGITRVESTTDEYTISNYTDSDIAYMENANIPDVILTQSNAASLIAQVKDLRIPGTSKAVCPVSSNNAVGLMQIQPIGTNNITNSATPTLNRAASYIGKTGSTLTLKDYCNPKTGLLLGGGFVLGKLNASAWTTSMNSKATIDTLVTGYYGCLKYPSCSTGPNSYGDDLWNSLQQCQAGGAGGGGSSQTASVESQIRDLFNKLPGISTAAVILPGGQIIEKGGNNKMPSYSVIKLFIAAAAYEASEQGIINLENSITINRNDAVQGTGIIQRGPFPQSLTIAELIDYMLVYSDNTATNLVINQIGGLEVVNSYASRSGYSQTQMQRYIGAASTTTDNFTSAKDSTQFMRDLYAKQVVNQGVSDAILNILFRRREYEDKQFVYIGRYLPASADFTEKSGLGATFRNDAGSFITKSGKRVYLSIMISNLTNDSAGEEAIAKAAQQIYNLVP